MYNVKKRDDEKVITLIVCGLFTGVLLAILFTAGNLLHMGAVLSGLAAVTIAGCALSWYQLIKNMADPRKDYWRWLCIVFAIATIIIIMGHRGAWLGKKQFDQDVNKAKVGELYSDPNSQPGKIPQ